MGQLIMGPNSQGIAHNTLVVNDDGSIRMQTVTATAATSSVVTVDTLQTVAAAATARMRVRIENVSAVAVYVKLGAGASATDFSTVLKACTAANDGTGGVFVEERYTGVITAVAATGVGNKVVAVSY